MSAAKDIADQAAREAVKEVFEKLGVDTDDPKSVEEFREDIRFSRSIRKKADMGTEAIFKLVFLTIAGAIMSAVAKHFHIGPHP
jgi:hypothetical protein